MKELFDLTRVLHNGMPVYPGTPAPRFDAAHIIQTSGYCETSLMLYSHVGTHMDAPAHLMQGGRTLDDYLPSRFFGKGMVLNLSEFAADQSIGFESLSSFEREAMGKVEIVLLDTGYDRGRDDADGYAVPSVELLHRAVQSGVRMVGIDRMSIDRMDSKDWPLHRILFDNDALILENLKGLSALHGIVFSVCALPLLYKGADGAPARVIAYTQ